MKKNFYYVLVFTNEGAVYVTGTSGSTAFFEKEQKPVDFGKSKAESIAMGLNLNGFNAVAVVIPFEIETQPYNYAEWVCSFARKEGAVK